MDRVENLGKTTVANLKSKTAKVAQVAQVD